jgi:hypothetical protein
LLPVAGQPEPTNFDARVRIPGGEALEQGRDPLPSYWTRCLPELLAAYSYICAYSCLRIAPATGAVSVEHFSAKSSARALAYEWSNYRLVCARMNSRKREYDDVLDPFLVEPGWFELELAFMQVLPGDELPAGVHAQVLDTIDRLKLNDELFCAERGYWYEEWLRNEISDDFFARNAPFVAYETMRQQIARPPVDAA